MRGLSAPAGFLTRRVGRRYEVERMRPLALCLAAVALVAPRPAAAVPTVTLNGVPIAGVTSQTFENCTVVIDEKGNIHIQAKGYAVRSAAGDAPRSPVEPSLLVSTEYPSCSKPSRKAANIASSSSIIKIFNMADLFANVAS